MSRTVSVTYYTYDELTPAAQARARDDYRTAHASDSADLAFVIEDAETILGLLGVSLKYHDVPLMGGGTRKGPNIWWSLGYVQGDGACFEGTYTYAKGAHQKIRQHAPLDTLLHDIADRLLEVQRRCRYKARVTVTNQGCGFCPTVEDDSDQGLSADTFSEIQQCMEDLCSWIYDQLRAEDQSRNEDAYVAEQIEANEYEFTEDGEMVNR